MRVVMLVDNHVDGDSRVQKSARYMASCGWDVTLIGRSRSTGRVEYDLDGARVILLPVNGPGAFHWNPTFRSWRTPLAYTDAHALERHQRQQTWRRMDLQSRLGSGASSRVLLPRRLALRLSGLVVSVRARQTRKARARFNEGSAGPVVHGSIQWRWDEPLLADMDVVMGTEIAALRPALIHAHDFRALPVAVRAADRLAAKGNRPVVVYDAHEYLPGIVMAKERALRGSVQAEAEHIGRVDAVVTVADGIADELVRAHHLRERPLVVANAPMRWQQGTPALDVRSEFGISPEQPVFVYLGNASEARGVATVVEGIGRLPGARLIMLTRRTPYLTTLLASAAAGGFDDRIIVRDYVEPDEVPAYISTATASLIPYPAQGNVNHELALPNKLFEAIQAGIPVVVSDMRVASDFVTSHGIGTSFTALDTESFIAAATSVIELEPAIRARLRESDLPERYCWETQCAPVDRLYRSLTGASPTPAAGIAAVLARMDAGDVPPDDERQAAISAACDQADLAAGTARQAEALATCERLLFHRTLHFDGTSSPLADDPRGYLRRWQSLDPMPSIQAASRAVSAAGGQRGRLTVLGYSNLAWAPPVVDQMTRLGFDVRVVDLADPEVYGPISDRALTQLALGSVPDRLAAALSSIYADCDTLWVEWAERAAVAATCVDPGSTRVIVRLHSYEAFKPALHYIRWGRVDDLVFVAPHYLDMVDAVFGASESYRRVRRHVIPTWLDADSLDRPKTPGARHVLGLVGWSAPAKDCAWAVRVLAEVHRSDPSFRLLVWGAGNSASAPPGVRSYEADVRALISELDLGDSVEFRGHTDEVGAALQDVGVILSSSVREGSHTGLAEGALSGAVPVVRDWPLVSRWNGPRRLYPADWVVDDVPAAAERIRQLTGDEGTWRTAGDRARTEARARFSRAAAAVALERMIDRA